MNRSSLQIHDRIRIGGIKLSPELVQFTYIRPKEELCSLTKALGVISEQQINITYLSGMVTADTVQTSFCVNAENQLSVKSALETSLGKNHLISQIPSVCTITLYPHRNSLQLIGRIIGLFASNDIAIYGVCTSISALSINIPYSAAQAGVQLLQGLVELPENHSPFQQEFKVKQINM